MTENLFFQDDDGERVALIKSLATNNRFYALVSGASGINNADTVEEIPNDLLLGIAYPCLEDGLNDFAVIRTTYETLELFPDDEALRHELSEMIADARRNLIWRLMELLERIIARKAYFLGTDLEVFKTSALDLMGRGFPRRNLDSMMKVNVFSSVAGDGADAAVYRYEFRNTDNLARLTALPPREFLLSLFSDVLDSVLDDGNYNSKTTFDRNVFQQFIALMFVSYASTDPVFYGTHKDDYGISRDKAMDDTPLYRAIRRELRHIAGKPPLDEPPSASSATTVMEERLRHEAGQGVTALASPVHPPAGEASEPLVQLPRMLANEDAVLRPIASIRALALQLQKHVQGDTSELSHLILAEASRLVDELKRLGVLSPLAYDPGAPEMRPSGGFVFAEDEDVTDEMT